MTTDNAPINVTGISPSTVPDLESAMDLNSVGNGYPNLFDALIQRVHDWTDPSELDDSALVPSETETTDNGVLLMGPDEKGAPSVHGLVRYYQIQIELFI